MKYIIIFPLSLILTICCSHAPKVHFEPYPRVVLAELFTHQGCINCWLGEQVLDSLKSERYPDSLALIFYHWRSEHDTFSPPEINNRGEWYGCDIDEFVGFFDGTFRVQEENPDKFAERFIEAIEFQKGEIPPLDISIDFSIEKENGQIKVTLFATDTLPSGDNRLFITITEDSLVDDFGNIINYVTRAVLPDWQGLPIKVAYAESLETTFTFINHWKSDNLTIIGFIQNMETRHILQTGIGKTKSQ